MKKPVAWIVAWSLYWLGDAVSRIMDCCPWEASLLYGLYQRLMGWASDVQDWGGTSGPWHNPTPQEPADE